MKQETQMDSTHSTLQRSSGQADSGQANSPQVAVFGGGCFWCTEAVFDMLKGVISVMPGYAGGTSTLQQNSGQASSRLRSSSGGQAGQGKPPTYEEVCSGRTGHAEVIKIEFDPSQISYRDLLTVFFATHDATTINRQGNDMGTQYRSIILYSTEDQKKEAEAFIKYLNDSDKRGNPVVTEIKPLEKFYEAEGYHHSYYKNNSTQSYCQVIISPKLKKVQEKFAELLKESENK